MPVESIIAIVVAATSAISSIATFAYVKRFKKSFEDQQGTSIRMISTLSKDCDDQGLEKKVTHNAEININMNYLEVYNLQLDELKKLQEQQTTITASKKIIDNKTTTTTAIINKDSIRSEITPLMLSATNNNSRDSSRTTNYTDNSLNEVVVTKDEIISVLDNNANGDRIISETTKAVTFRAFEALEKIVLPLYQHILVSSVSPNSDHIKLESEVAGNNLEHVVNM